MISTDESPESERRTFRFAVLASALLHALLLPPALWLFSTHLITPPHISSREMDVMALSTSIRFSPRTTPHAPAPAHRDVKAAVVKQVRAPERAAQAAPIPKPRAVSPHELAKIATSAPPDATASPQPGGAPGSFSQRLAQERAAFAREVAQLREQAHTLSIATAAPAPAAMHRYTMDLSGSQRTQDGNGVVSAVREWDASGLHCYYGRLAYEFPDGAREDEDIPWPFCFPAYADPMAMNPHLIPIPTPLPGYVLPPSRAIGPILRRTYEIWLAHH